MNYYSQAVSGQLKILTLRERAELELGDTFDVRAFHDEVLGGGALPLDILELRMDDWLADQTQATMDSTLE